MEESTDKAVVQCGCDPFPAPEEGQGCEGCSPNLMLTCEEEAILANMRQVKGQVRSIEDRLHAIKDHISTSPEGDGSEWTELSSHLDKLRSQWEDWAAKLESATDRKMELLGHREP